MIEKTWCKRKPVESTVKIKERMYPLWRMRHAGDIAALGASMELCTMSAEVIFDELHIESGATMDHAPTNGTLAERQQTLKRLQRIELAKKHQVYLMRILSILKVRRLRCVNVKFTRIPIGALKYPCLKEVILHDCVNVEFFLEHIAPGVRDLEVFIETRSDPIVMHSVELQHRISNAICNLAGQLETNYKLRGFEYSKAGTLAALDTSASNKLEAATSDTVKASLVVIKQIVERNVNGYDKCRSAIRQLFLIKRYAPENPFKNLNRDVVMIIAKLIYGTIGTKVWCQ